MEKLNIYAKKKNVHNQFIVICLYLCRSGNGWWWVPLIAPLIGGLLGAGLYKALVEMHHPPLSEQGEGLVKEETVPLGKQENMCVNVCISDPH